MTDISGYKVDLEAMTVSTCGMVGVAEKDGRRYFCKQFNTPVLPSDSKAMSPKTVAKNTKLFEAFSNRKRRVNARLREIAGEGGNIVFPIHETVYNNHWMEFTEYINGAIPENQYFRTIAGLSEEKKLLVLKIAVGALQTIHGQRLIHGDLKLTNIMLVRNDRGNYVSKIIDFDGAFFEDDVPEDSITGTMDYYSPELAIYSDKEDPEERKAVSKYITTKSDIFTMGLVLHEYLAGEKPQPDALPASLQKMKAAGKFIYPWQILLTREKGKPPCQLVISDKIKEPAYVALISDMLALEPEQRPTAAEVMGRLSNRKLPIETEPWPEDKIFIPLELAKTFVVALRKSKGGEGRLYEIVALDGRRYLRTADELVNMGAALRADTWVSPDPGDGIEWNLERIKKNFLAILPKEAGAYGLIDKNGVKRKMTCNQLKLMGFAKSAPKTTPPAPVKTPVAAPPSSPVKTPVAAPPSPPVKTPVAAPPSPPVKTPVAAPPSPPVKTPVAPPPSPSVKTPVAPPPAPDSPLRPEDAALYKLNDALLTKSGIRFLGPSVWNGVEGYRFRMSNGSEIFRTPQNCKMMSFFVPKK